MSTEKATEVPLLEGINREGAALRSANQQQEPRPPRERPILFSSEMVRAILDGRKTQTRRVVLRREKDEGEWVTARPDRGYTAETITREYRNPFGQPGDRLWVRETWNCPRQLGGSHQREKLIYRADSDKFGVDYSSVLWAPSIFLPRWASRIALEITRVRVERVQDISPDDVTAEGLPHRQATPDFLIGSSTPDYRWYWGFPTPAWNGGDDFVYDSDHKRAYGELWNRINEERGYGWDKNPWVWVIEFRPVVDRELAVD